MAPAFIEQIHIIMGSDTEISVAATFASRDFIGDIIHYLDDWFSISTVVSPVVPTHCSIVYTEHCLS